MERRVFAMYAALICAIMGAIIGYSVSKGDAVLPVIAFGLGLILIMLGKRRVREIIEDERTLRVSERASRATCQIFAICSALIGTTLIASGSYTEVGNTLAFSSIILVVLYMVFYAYYNNKPLV